MQLMLRFKERVAYPEGEPIPVTPTLIKQRRLSGLPAERAGCLENFQTISNLSGA